MFLCIIVQLNRAYLFLLVSSTFVNGIVCRCSGGAFFFPVNFDFAFHFSLSQYRSKRSPYLIKCKTRFICGDCFYKMERDVCVCVFFSLCKWNSIALKCVFEVVAM